MKQRGGDTKILKGGGANWVKGLSALKRGGTGILLRTMTVFDSVSSNIDEVLSINPSANVFVFGDFHNVHHKDWPTYSGGTD